MAVKKPVDSMGINWEEIEGMAQRFVPAETIRQSLGLTPKQFKRAIRWHYKKSIEQWWDMYAAQGRVMIYQQQFEQARGGSVTALKWLGIQHLGQRVNVETLFKPGDKGGEEKPKEEVQKGFAILTPEGMEPPVQSDPAVQQPHDETPAVEQIILAEVQEKPDETTEGPRPTNEVEAYPNEHEA